MTALSPCPRCRRHLRVSEPSCPFCGEERLSLEARPLAPAGLSRAQLVVFGAALAAGCASTPAPGPQPPAATSAQPAPAAPGQPPTPATHGPTQPPPGPPGPPGPQMTGPSFQTPPASAYGSPPMTMQPAPPSLPQAEVSATPEMTPPQKQQLRELARQCAAQQASIAAGSGVTLELRTTGPDGKPEAFVLGTSGGATAELGACLKTVLSSALRDLAAGQSWRVKVKF